MSTVVTGALRRRGVFVAFLAGVALPGWVGVSAASANPTCNEQVKTNVTLTSSLSCSGNGLIVAKSGITINLNGYSITGPGGSAFGHPGIYNEYSGVTVENGTIQDFYWDVWNQGKSATYKSLRLYTDGTQAYYPFYDEDGTGTKLSDSLTDNGAEGILTAHTASDQFSHDSDIGSEYGIESDDDLKASYTDNTMQGEDDGVYIEGGSSGLTFTDNVATLPSHGYAGFYDYTGGSGIKLTGNRAYGGEYGFDNANSSSPPWTVSDNLASGQSDAGFSFAGNYVESKTGTYTGNTVTGNRALDSAQDGFEDFDSYGSTWSDNIAEGNAGDGIVIYEPLDYKITADTAQDNVVTGIYLYGNGSEQPTSFSGNLAVGNEDDGLAAGAPLPANAGKNTAYNNDPFDCYNVTCQTGATSGAPMVVKAMAASKQPAFPRAATSALPKPQGWVDVSAASAANPSASCGETVMTSVTLTGDLSCSGDGLIVGKSGIVIDLNGYSITGPGGSAGSYEGIKNDAGFNGVTVENGTIQDFHADVDNEDSKSSTYKSLRLYADGTQAYTPFYDYESTGTKLSDSLTDNGDQGIYTNDTTSDQFSHDSDIGSEYGIDSDGDLKASYSDDTMQGEDDGVYIEGGSSGLTFTDNVATLPPDTSGCCNAGFLDYAGGSGIKLTGNRAYGGYAGFANPEGSPPWTVSDNLASGQECCGFAFAGNYVESKSGTYTGNTVTGNRALYSGADGFEDYDSYGSTWSDNVAEGNAYDGIFIAKPLDDKITGNTVQDNGLVGIYLDENGSDQPSSFSGNLAVGNDDDGLAADDPLPTSAGKNTAYNNDPFDCYNVTCQTGATSGAPMVVKAMAAPKQPAFAHPATPALPSPPNGK